MSKAWLARLSPDEQALYRDVYLPKKRALIAEVFGAKRAKQLGLPGVDAPAPSRRRKRR